MNITIEVKQKTKEAKELIRKWYDEIPVIIDGVDYLIDSFETYLMPTGLQPNIFYPDADNVIKWM